MDVFLSHASGDNETARGLEEDLEEAGVDVWTDLSDMRAGPLVDAELLAKIRATRLLLLLWSKSADASAWVAAEWLVAFHEDKLVVPCTVDETELPQALRKAAYVDLRWRRERIIDRIRATAKTEPLPRTRIMVPTRGRRSPELWQKINDVIRDQTRVLQSLSRAHVDAARSVQKSLDPAVEALIARWPNDTLAVTLEGYHRKNTYQIAHHDAIQAGLRPADPELDAAERCFFRALSIDPTDHAALNGMGNYRWFRMDLEAAEFFTRKAIEYAKNENADPTNYLHDLRLIQRDLAANAPAKPL